MKKTNKDKEELKDKCNCGNECNCGQECHCTEDNKCSEECNCNHEEENGCNGSCEGCSGCGSVDNDTIIQILTARNKELEEKYMRLQAEYLNFKTRTQNEVSRKLLYEGEEFIKELLPIKDNLERAIMMDDNDLSDEVSKFLSGIKMVLGNLTALFDKFEIKEIECLGNEFDPMLEDAVLIEHDENKPENVVLEVLSKGYKYKDKVIRHSTVKVNK